MRVAVITMVYNEPYFLPIWYRHYGAQVGEENLFVIDHGSTDGCVSNSRGSRVRLPRTPFDNRQRADMVADLHASLLRYYDVVIYTDCDEYLVARPSKFASLVEYAKRQPCKVVRCVGVNVMPNSMTAQPVDTKKPILRQRPYGFVSHWYCKPLYAAVPMSWEPGFHNSKGMSFFDQNLWMFHLKWVNGVPNPETVPWLPEKLAGASESSLDGIDIDQTAKSWSNSGLGRIPDEFLEAL